MIGTYAENVSRELDKLDGVLENLLVRQNQTNTKLGLLAKILEMIINNTEKGNIASLKINEIYRKNLRLFMKFCITISNLICR